jgi:hypothetical protein
MASFKVLLNIALISNRLQGKYQKVYFRAHRTLPTLVGEGAPTPKGDVCKFMLQQVLIVYCNVWIVQTVREIRLRRLIHAVTSFH